MRKKCMLLFVMMFLITGTLGCASFSLSWRVSKQHGYGNSANSAMRELNKIINIFDNDKDKDIMSVLSKIAKNTREFHFVSVASGRNFSKGNFGKYSQFTEVLGDKIYVRLNSSPEFLMHLSVKGQPMVRYCICPRGATVNDIEIDVSEQFWIVFRFDLATGTLTRISYGSYIIIDGYGEHTFGGGKTRIYVNSQNYRTKEPVAALRLMVGKALFNPDQRHVVLINMGKTSLSRSEYIEAYCKNDERANEEIAKLIFRKKHLKKNFNIKF
jgi:hypothetical protein